MPPQNMHATTERLPHSSGNTVPSVVFAIASAVLGYVLAGYGPLWFGGSDAVSAAGMIATISGVILGLACLLAPHRSRIGVPRPAEQ